MSRSFLFSLAAVCCKARGVVSAAVLVVAGASTSWATPTLTLPNFNLVPNQAGQVITLPISGGDAIQLVNVVIEIGGNVAGPIMTAFDLSGVGLIFNGNANPPSVFSPPLPGRELGVGITTASGTVTANGNLIRLTLDTTSIPAGQYQYRLNNHPSLGNTDFGVDNETGDPVYGNLIYTHPDDQQPNPNGGGYSLLIIPEINIPEPASLALGLMAAAGFGIVVIRRRYR